MRGCLQRDLHRRLGDDGVSGDDAIDDGEGFKLFSAMVKIRGVYAGALLYQG